MNTLQNTPSHHPEGNASPIDTSTSTQITSILDTPPSPDKIAQILHASEWKECQNFQGNTCYIQTLSEDDETILEIYTNEGDMVFRGEIEISFLSNGCYLKFGSFGGLSFKPDTLRVMKNSPDISDNQQQKYLKKEQGFDEILDAFPQNSLQELYNTPYAQPNTIEKNTDRIRKAYENSTRYSYSRSPEIQEKIALLEKIQNIHKIRNSRVFENAHISLAQLRSSLSSEELASSCIQDLHTHVHQMGEDAMEDLKKNSKIASGLKQNELEKIYSYLSFYRTPKQKKNLLKSFLSLFKNKKG